MIDINDWYKCVPQSFPFIILLSPLTSTPSFPPPGIISAITWPTSLLTLASVIDNPWGVCCRRSAQVGKQLAEVLLQGQHGRRPVTLIGFSLGARVIYYCLQVWGKKVRLCIHVFICVLVYEVSVFAFSLYLYVYLELSLYPYVYFSHSLSPCQSIFLCLCRNWIARREVTVPA